MVWRTIGDLDWDHGSVLTMLQNYLFPLVQWIIATFNSISFLPSIVFLFDSFLPIILGNFIVLSICKKFYVNQYYPKLIIPLTDNSACDRMGTQGTVANHKWWYREIATFPYSPDWGIVIASYSNHWQRAGGQCPVSSQWIVLRGGFSWSRPRPGPTSGLDLGSAVIVGAEADWDQLSMTASGRQLELVPTQQLAICCTAVSKYKDVCRVVTRMTAPHSRRLKYTQSKLFSVLLHSPRHT